jgi:hypothetical protein
MKLKTVFQINKTESTKNMFKHRNWVSVNEVMDSAELEVPVELD